MTFLPARSLNSDPSTPSSTQVDLALLSFQAFELLVACPFSSSAIRKGSVVLPIKIPDGFIQSSSGYQNSRPFQGNRNLTQRIP